ncbi:TATA-binding protein-associated factor mot1 [Datura stramonium]|uniref:TATA-binding protein-associated factor mot1 n=1 Tax=Datura stramonium TaxID=4076 RepID=A0ABS8WVG0_DATST|nr:TATA-binding protein-associated factor mot1 [Datura stramonium]
MHVSPRPAEPSTISSPSEAGATAPAATAAAPTPRKFVPRFRREKIDTAGQTPPPETDRWSSGSRSKWAELNGATGDLGTYIPIVLALTLASDLNLGTTLIFTGVYNFVTGAIYGVPMPVQPMKSIAAVAISNPEFGIPEVMAAGICTAGILFLLGVTGLMQLVYRLIPVSVVRGIQLAQGLSFAMTAVKYIKNVQDFAKSKSGGERDWLGLDGLLLALICAVFIVIVNGAGEDQNGNQESTETGDEEGWCSGKRVKKIVFSLPSAFLIFLLGVVLAIIRGPNAVKGFKFGPSRIEVVSISKQAWKQGFIKGTIPQLPLSVLNSVIAVCKLSTDLFPEREITATSVSMTVGLMNLIGCWFGAMPCCHGAGGLAGQYKFGGRSGGCVALLGVAKLVLGLVLGSSMVKVLTQFPVGVLGVLLLFAGIELAMCSRDMNTKEESFVVLVCTAVSMVGSSAALGFLCGIVAHLLLKMRNMSSDGHSCTSVLWFHRNP